jgi:hypothetical protein
LNYKKNSLTIFIKEAKEDPEKYIKNKIKLKKVIQTEKNESTDSKTGVNINSEESTNQTQSSVFKEKR